MSTTITKNPNGTFDIKTGCEKCGKPLINVNEHGMFCEDYCGLEESRKAKKIIQNLISKIINNISEE